MIARATHLKTKTRDDALEEQADPAEAAAAPPTEDPPESIEAVAVAMAHSRSWTWKTSETKRNAKRPRVP